MIQIENKEKTIYSQINKIQSRLDKKKSSQEEQDIQTRCLYKSNQNIKDTNSEPYKIKSD